MIKAIVIIIVIIAIGFLAYWLFQSETGLGQACLSSGGEVSTSLCCKTAADFPNLCLIGACGCSPQDSHEVKVCICPENYCFDGESCVVQGASLGPDPLNTTYSIESESITLKDGYAEKEIVPGAASKIKVGVFGGLSYEDLNGDELEDGVLILTYNAGGSGTFYYIAASLQDQGGYKGTDAVLLGDRISPKDIQIEEGVITVNYADRYPWEPLTATTTVNKTKSLEVKQEELQEILGKNLSQETALELAKEEWGECEECDSLEVSVLDGKDGAWYVQAIYDGLRDDSIEAEKKIATAHYVDEAWELGETLVEEQKCYRGHQDFSTEPCL